MNSINMRFVSLLTALLIVGFSYGQEEKMYQGYAVHEDIVKPSKMAQYEAVAKEFTEVMNKYKGEVADLTYLCAMTDNMRYMFVWPIDKMADLDKNPIGEVREKMGAEKFDDMMSRMDECYDSHSNYTISLDKEMSYMPEGISQTQEGMNYREYHYYYTSPSMVQKLAKKGKAIKDHHQKVNSDSRYRVYRSGFGTAESFFMVAISAKDAAHMAEMQQANMSKLGPDYQKLLNDALKYTTRYEKYTGWIREDLSVTAVQPTKKK
ncbi:MAG: hypothetical protein HKN00_01805 [Flavobacteriaceae bacterium]|nr:hypothetical protein [Bacteroidia bacterium]NNF73889.1 hypothetical protein [Flavobacteriaceae bacterium]NNK74249.1 hypothetical protein [Flavobacteriaceae bacterium]